MASYGGGGSYDDDYAVDPGVEESPEDVPDFVKTFVGYLYRSIRDKNVYEVHQMYEASFHKLSERFFTQTAWPSAELIAPFVDNDHVFCLLYKEMYFRHVYAKLNVTLQDRFQSWDNYCSLFTVILHGNVNMQLPNQWLWDMIDEFIYQFRSFCQYRGKLKNKTEQELAMLRKYDEVWNVYGVLSLLQALVDRSNILQILEDEKDGSVTFTATDGYDYEGGGSNVLKVLGYFSIVGLLQVHCLLGDYHNALKCLLPIDLSQQGVYSSITGCYITVAYYNGFANMMVRRYVEAIKMFNQNLLFILKTKQYLQKLPQYELMTKKMEQMYALLCICLSLSPHIKLIDESVHKELKEKRGNDMNKLQQNSDEGVFEELFTYACPKFVTPSAPDYNDLTGNYNEGTYRMQLKQFLSEVRQQQLLNKVRAYLKLYTSISITKLASFLELDEATLRTALMTYKHKTHVTEDRNTLVSNADTDFYIDEDMVHIAESKPTKRYGDTFVRLILKFEELTGELERARVE